ncbi:type II secretion system F family protein [Bacillus timonensis]|nr:type II secretion system F family protein [Bacillus timonensis]
MLHFLFIVCSTLSIMLACAALLHMLFRRELIVQERVNHYFGKNEQIKQKQEKKKFYQQSLLLQKYWDLGVQQVSKYLEKRDQKKLEVMLRDAGFLTKSAVEFRLIQLLITVGSGLATFILFTPIADKKSSVIFVAIAVGILFYRFPLFYLAKKKTQRIKQINREMADFFDMVNLLLEAGSGLEGAIANVCARTTGPLSDEFRQALDDMKRGKSRREAFYSMRKRIPSDSFQSVILSIIQADHLGIGMARVINSLTTRIREQRREAAREQAMKAPIKMLFPMVIFIFPSLFIVIIGPIMVKIITEGLG